jgi:hypothetical protein
LYIFVDRNSSVLELLNYLIADLARRIVAASVACFAAVVACWQP